MAEKLPSFKYEDCVACGICVQACPISALTLSKTDFDSFRKAYPALSDRPCNGCTLCEKSCPMGAIDMRAGS